MNNVMHSIADAIPGALNQSSLVCKRCGNEVTFAPKQWRKACGKCGMVISLPRPIVIEQQKEDRQPACFLCGDRGVVFYQEQEGQHLYNFAAKCVCRTGQERKESLPALNQVDNICSLQYLEQKNRQEWEKRTGKKVQLTLLTDAEEVSADVEEIPF